MSIFQFMIAVGEMAQGASAPSIPPVWQRHYKKVDLFQPLFFFFETKLNTFIHKQLRRYTEENRAQATEKQSITK